MIPSPIHKVLSLIRKHQVRYLLMGGQACVLYGGAEFSRDLDLVLLCQEANMGALGSALGELNAEVITVPPFEINFLRRGHAVHFRCHCEEAEGLRIDVMSRMRNVEDFAVLWERRNTIETDFGDQIEVLALPDLVQAKKTQRDKDWPMIRRLLEAHYFQNRNTANQDQILFWLNEMRTPELLQEIPKPDELKPFVNPQRLWVFAPCFDVEECEKRIKNEEELERAADKKYWQSLKLELESLRLSRIAKPK